LSIKKNVIIIQSVLTLAAPEKSLTLSFYLIKRSKMDQGREKSS
jgi:hypothetical protein